MEIYKETNTDKSKEFEKLLDNQISKTKNLVEGKIIEGTVTKVGEKYVFLFILLIKNQENIVPTAGRNITNPIMSVI